MDERGVWDHESEAEREVFRRVFLPHCPPPDCQVWIDRYRVDFAYVAAALVIEYFGEWHRDRIHEDHARIAGLRALGCEVVVLTKTFHRDPRGVAAHVNAVRVEREHLVAAGALPGLAVPVRSDRGRPMRTMHPTF